MKSKKLWQRLEALAEPEVKRVLKRLPAPIRERMDSVPIVFDTAPGPELTRTGVEPDLMGLFTGDSLADPLSDAISPEIRLFLLNIWDEAEGDEADYAEQVRTTLLHEIGHYIGLEEGDLEERGLE